MTDAFFIGYTFPNFRRGTQIKWTNMTIPIIKRGIDMLEIAVSLVFKVNFVTVIILLCIHKLFFIVKPRNGKNRKHE